MDKWAKHVHGDSGKNYNIHTLTLTKLMDDVKKRSLFIELLKTKVHLHIHVYVHNTGINKLIFLHSSMYFKNFKFWKNIPLR